MDEQPDLRFGPQKTKPPALCDICGFPMIGVHCKLRCSSCGYTRDCSDP